jgi:hypothetical protein
MTTPRYRHAAAAAALAAAAIACAACTVPPPGRAPACPRPAASRTRHAAPPATPGLTAPLPITPAQLRAAAVLAARFAAAYDTHAPGQPGAWLARLRPMAASQLAAALARAAATPALWRSGQTAAGQAVAEQVRDLTPGSVIFTVQVRQALTTPAGRSTAAGDLAVTVVLDGGGPAVYDIEPAAAGNAG